MNKRRTTLEPIQACRSDEELVQLICDRDEAALVEVIGLYSGQVNALCKRICGDELEASGVVSEVFWEFWRNASNFNSQRGSLRSYLLTIARSRALDRYRSEICQQRRQNRYIEWAATGNADFFNLDLPELGTICSEEAKEVQAALERLPKLQQQTLLLAFFDGLSHREVSEQMGLPLGSVKTHIRTGLLRLRHLLASFGERTEFS